MAQVNFTLDMSQVNTSQLSSLLRDQLLSRGRRGLGEVDIHGNQFVRNTAGGPSAGGCTVAVVQMAMGGALSLLAKNLTLEDNLAEDNEACGYAWTMQPGH
jgi:hypothetical protein